MTKVSLLKSKQILNKKMGAQRNQGRKKIKHLSHFIRRDLGRVWGLNSFKKEGNFKIVRSVLDLLTSASLCLFLHHLLYCVPQNENGVHGNASGSDACVGERINLLMRPKPVHVYITIYTPYRALGVNKIFFLK